MSILHDYANAYAKIMNKQRAIRHYAYIDAFAGAGAHVSKTTGEEIDGSPSKALSVQPGFSHYHFIEIDPQRAKRLRYMTKERNNVTVYEGDCNSVLLNEVFPKCRWDNRRRALCLLDPYGLSPDWKVAATAGQMKSIEVFLNFMIMDANMNILWNNPDKVTPTQIERMNVFWGDDSWRKAAYTTHPGLFGDMQEKAMNQAVISAYQRRLKEIAGFKYVPDPMPMRNTRGATIYYLFFASNNETGSKIARSVFKKYANRGIKHGV